VSDDVHELAAVLEATIPGIPNGTLELAERILASPWGQRVQALQFKLRIPRRSLAELGRPTQEFGVHVKRQPNSEGLRRPLGRWAASRVLSHSVLLTRA